MVNVNAIESRNVSVQITAAECFKGLCTELNVLSLIKPDYGIIYKETRKNDKLVQLTELEDTSRHGSANFEETGCIITNPKTLQSYELMAALNAIHHYL